MRNLFAHEWTVRLLPALATFIAVKYLLFAKGAHKFLGYRLFFVGIIGVIFFWWLMARKDLRHLREQEALSARDPKHLFDVSSGFKANPRERMGVILSLALMGTGLLVAAFGVSDIGLIFSGAGCCLIAASIWALT